MTQEIPVFARSPNSHPLGKLTWQSKVDLPEIVGEEIVSRASQCGMTTAEMIREVLSWWACPELMQSVLDQRAKVARGNLAGNVLKSQFGPDE
ncbi:hypothetical protein ACUXAV_000347 [Cupriavidus metallidurans]|uniref:hypothetical protein n=1 Tax=Cupriavidus metallidurans TaxID=119219 RepID=UPI0004938C14|nr:hypothetical protein [Cupriavidus metallidurans]MDE4918307.1 hypothetical protein [Cupriavidus metallidurans]